MMQRVFLAPAGGVLPKWALHRRIFMWMLAAGFAFCLSDVDAQSKEAPGRDTGVVLESGVKAAFLYRFLGYVEWPPGSAGDSNSPVTIGVFGADHIAAELSQIVTARTVNGRPLAVKRIKEGDQLTCIQVLFIGQTDAARIGQLLKMAQPRSILTVTETDGALAQGSVINFRMVEGRIRFEVSLEAADKSNLKLSSRMLAVAHHVQKSLQ
jgi:hypothetical protein